MKNEELKKEKTMITMVQTPVWPTMQQFPKVFFGVWSDLE